MVMHLHCLVVTFGYMKQTGCYKSFLQLAATTRHACFKYTEQSLGGRLSQAAGLKYGGTIKAQAGRKGVT